jgi:Na+/melibiose symporter-like transporter
MVTIKEPKLSEQAITIEREYKIRVHGEEFTIAEEETANNSG